MIFMLFRNPDEASTSRHGDLVNQMARLTLGSTCGQTFVKFAVENGAILFGDEDWKDPSKKVPHTCKSQDFKPKVGDTAEVLVFKFLSQEELCTLLGEPVYVISGNIVVKCL